MKHFLYLFALGQQVATIAYQAKDDLWSLEYDTNWLASPKAFPLSPTLPLFAAQNSHASGVIKRFVENLLPEGRALDISASTYGVSKNNVFALIQQLGVETAGAFRFGIDSLALTAEEQANPKREITLEELEDRLSQRDQIPFVVWDKKVRMSIAGYQDKLTVLLHQDHGKSRLFLAEPPLASTHILKPEPMGKNMPHLVVNEYYCMTLAKRMGFPVAEVSMLRVPRPILLVKRFDRELIASPMGLAVKRLHMIDACQASDLPVSFKYERNLGSNEQVRHIRDGMSFEKLFACVDQTVDKASAKLSLLRWALFQFLIGNCDAHGKNFSFFVERDGLVPAPWYDLVSVVQYPEISHELAMAFGDVFELEEVKGFALADFAQRCAIPRTLLHREAVKVANSAIKHAEFVASGDEFAEEEQAFIAKLSAFVIQQSELLKIYTKEASKIDSNFL
ncbi:MAG: HipA domain-containing protein [Burkholderiales bacterium]|nr:HipA domain-containing protein [Burkholderiales bacterium]